MLLRDGIQPAELKRAVATLKTVLENKASTAATRKSQEIADAIVRTLNDDELYTSPAQDLAFAAPIFASVTPADADAALKSLFSGHGPILFRSAEQAPAGDAALGTALASAYSRPLGAAVKEVTIAWPYANSGKPGAVLSRTADQKLGTTTVKFANGTRLFVKPTGYEKDRVAVAVLLGSGRAGVPAGMTRAIWEGQLYPLSGTKKLSLGEITQWAQENGKVISVAFEPGVRAFVLSGTTRPTDLGTQMQLLEAYARDPGFRSEAFEKAKSVAPMLAGQIRGNAGAAYSREAQAVMAGGDPRFALLPSDDDLARVAPQDLPRLLKQPLGGQADIVMVGDLTVEDAIKATQESFGSGPPGTRAALAPARVKIPESRPDPFVVEHSGRSDQAFYGEYFGLPDYFANPMGGDVADVAAAIISSRLVDTVREQLGITYSPQVQAVSAIDLPGEAYLGVTLETPPANFGKFHDLLTAQLKDLAAKPVSADELARAKQPLIETERKKRETNAFWLAKLAQVARDPRVEQEALGKLGRMEGVTPADVQTLIAKYAAGRIPVTIIARSKP